MITFMINNTVVSFIQKLYLMILFNSWTASSIIRYVMESKNITSYEKCVEFLSITKTIAPCYFIITGSNRNEGVIIEKGYKHLKIHNINDNENHFLIQTNDDIDIIKKEIYNKQRTVLKPTQVDRLNKLRRLRESC